MNRFEQDFLQKFETRLKSDVNQYLESKARRELYGRERELSQPDEDRIYWDLLRKHNLKLHDISDELYEKKEEISIREMKRAT